MDPVNFYTWRVLKAGVYDSPAGDLKVHRVLSPESVNTPPAPPRLFVYNNSLTNQRFRIIDMRDPTAHSDSETGRIEVKNTTCYMCACRCGIRVTLRDGEVRNNFV